MEKLRGETILFLISEDLPPVTRTPQRGDISVLNSNLGGEKGGRGDLRISTRLWGFKNKKQKQKRKLQQDATQVLFSRAHQPPDPPGQCPLTSATAVWLRGPVTATVGTYSAVFTNAEPAEGETHPQPQSALEPLHFLDPGPRKRRA